MQKMLFGVLSRFLAALLLVLAVAVVGVRAFGLTPCPMRGDPFCPDGCLLYLKYRNPDSLQPGDKITVATLPARQNLTCTVLRVEQADRLVWLRGQPQPVGYDQLLGRPVFWLPYLGFLIGWLQTPPGRCAAAALLLAVLLLRLVPGPGVRARAAERSVPKEPCAAGKGGNP